MAERIGPARLAKMPQRLRQHVGSPLRANGNLVEWTVGNVRIEER